MTETPNSELTIKSLPFNGFKYPIGGRIAILQNETYNDIIKTINEKKVEAVSLNCSIGWTRDDLTFLSELSEVKSLSIITTDAKNLSSIEGMSSLEKLSITSTSKEVVDFTCLKKLKQCYLNWWEGASSIFSCSWLNELYLDEAKRKDFSDIENLTGLEKLVIANSNIKSLNWISKLTNLKDLELINCRILEDFSPISQLSKLEKLTINGCKKLRDISFVSHNLFLEILSISNCGSIESLSSLVKANKLKALFMSGTTVIEDGKLGYLDKLPNLAILSFTGKKHYTHKLTKKWKWDDIDNPETLLKLK